MAVANVDLFAQVFTNAGLIGTGYKIKTYAGGTTTPLASYTSSTGGVANANPIVADSAGRYECWITVGVAYKFELLTAADVVLVTVDNFLINSSGTATSSNYADPVFIYAGGPPSATEWVGGERFTRACTFAANFSGSYGYTHTNPTASFAIDVKKNGSTVGTITVATNGTFTFATSAGATVSIVAGDRIDAFAPGVTDATMANFTFTLAGTLV